jgi:diadenosine tetraphosphate (Ap4A) HIT family hydrolase
MSPGEAEGGCAFCERLRAGENALEGKLAVAFADAFPVSPGHTLVVPRRHVGDFFALTDDEQVEVWALAREVHRRLGRERHPAGCNVGINVGRAAGQTIGHAHLHVIPRYERDVADPRGGVRWVIPERAAYWDTNG